MSTDPFEAWRRRRENDRDRATLIDLYRMVAESKGLPAHELPLAERAALAARALPIMWPGYQVPTGTERDPEPIEIVAYDPEWPARFESWRRRVSEALGAAARRIEHVGSTAVPGMPAKPVIDVHVSVEDPDQETAYVPPIEGLGLQLRSRDELHRYFRPASGRPRDVQVHVSAVGSGWERRHLLFRDYLRTDTAARDAYLAAKLEAARLWRDDRIAYADAKTEVISAILDRAEEWASETHWQT